jgi:hypothetical protein
MLQMLLHVLLKLFLLVRKYDACIMFN